jgi:superfamily I DNA/RNA helicase
LLPCTSRRPPPLTNQACCACFARLALNPADDAAFLRVINTPSRRLGDKLTQQLEEEQRGLMAALEEQQQQHGQHSWQQQGQLFLDEQLGQEQEQQQQHSRVSLFHTAEGLLQQGRIGTRHEKQLRLFLATLRQLRAAALAGAPVETVEAVLRIEGFATHVQAAQNKKKKEQQDKKHDSKPQDAAGQEAAAGSDAAAAAAAAAGGRQQSSAAAMSEGATAATTADDDAGADSDTDETEDEEDEEEEDSEEADGLVATTQAPSELVSEGPGLCAGAVTPGLPSIVWSVGLCQVSRHRPDTLPVLCCPRVLSSVHHASTQGAVE